MSNFDFRHTFDKHHQKQRHPEQKQIQTKKKNTNNMPRNYNNHPQETFHNRTELFIQPIPRPSPRNNPDAATATRHWMFSKQTHHGKKRLLSADVQPKLFGDIGARRPVFSLFGRGDFAHPQVIKQNSIGFCCRAQRAAWAGCGPILGRIGRF